jgi:hypothetical protein
MAGPPPEGLANISGVTGKNELVLCPQNGRRREQKAFKPLQDYLKLFLRHDTRSYFRNFQTVGAQHVGIYFPFCSISRGMLLDL